MDIGTGTGLLSMMAVRAGAEQAYAIEGSPEMARIAGETLRRNGMGARVKLLGALSTNVQVPRDIPEPRPTLLVSEILDSGLLGERALPTLRHATRHLLAEGGTCIPAAATVMVQAIQCEWLRRQHVLSAPSAGAHAGFDVAAVAQLFAPEPYTCEQLQQVPHKALSEPGQALHVRLDGGDGLRPGKSATVDLRVTDTGKRCGCRRPMCCVSDTW